MRSGTSRGPYFLKDWLPADPAERDRVLLSAIGAFDKSEIDGIGGGTTLTSKVAIVSKSSRDGCDVDYLFAQLTPGQSTVDTKPNCGNMLAGVGPFSIEQGLVVPKPGQTVVRVHNVNTGSRIDVSVQTPDRAVTYEGETKIAGVSRAAAPVVLTFRDFIGSVTRRLFPTGARVDRIDDLWVTCIDAAMPMVLIPAAALGLSGTESAAELDATPGLLDRLESIRRKAGALMGMGDVSNSVVPKPVIVARHEDPDAICSRYFTPRRCHAAHAVTGAIGVATAFTLPGTVASGAPRKAGHHTVRILHPSGVTNIGINLVDWQGELVASSAEVVRTVRKIMEGSLQINC